MWQDPEGSESIVAILSPGVFQFTAKIQYLENGLFLTIARDGNNVVLDNEDEVCILIAHVFTDVKFTPPFSHGHLNLATSFVDSQLANRLHSQQHIHSLQTKMYHET